MNGKDEHGCWPGRGFVDCFPVESRRKPRAGVGGLFLHPPSPLPLSVPHHPLQHQRTLSAMHNLAATYQQVDDLDSAEAIMTELYEAQLKSQGPEVRGRGRGAHTCDDSRVTGQRLPGVAHE